MCNYCGYNHGILLNQEVVCPILKRFPSDNSYASKKVTKHSFYSSDITTLEVSWSAVKNEIKVDSEKIDTSGFRQVYNENFYVRRDNPEKIERYNGPDVIPPILTHENTLKTIKGMFSHPKSSDSE